MSRSLLGLLLVTSAGVLWGAMASCVQYLFLSDQVLTPLALVSSRLLAAGLIFVALSWWRWPKQSRAIFAARAGALSLLASGALMFCAHYTFFESVYYSNAGTGAILLALVPLLAGLYMFCLGQRGFTLAEALCLALAIGGIALIVTDGDWSTLKFSPLAIVWGLASAGCACAYSIQPMRSVARFGPAVTSAWSMLIGGLCGLLVWRPETLEWHWQTSQYLAFAFVVLCGTVLAFWCYLAGRQWVSPVTTGLLVCCEPLVAYLASILFLGDRLGLWQAAGVLMVLANVCLLALWGSRPIRRRG